MSTAQVADKAAPARHRGRDLIAAVPAWGWLGIVFAGSVALRFGLSLSVQAPWVFQDEIVYADLARSLGQHGHFALRQAPGTNGFGPLYPILLSPAYAIFSSPEKAYVVVRLINAILMSLAVFPIYVLARRLMRPGFAVVAAGLGIAIPSLFYTTTLFSENAFFPAVVAASTALILALERPTLTRQVAFFGFALLAFLVRAQGVILVPALIGAILLAALSNAWRDGRFNMRAFGRELWRFRLTWLVVGTGSLLVFVYERVRGQSVTAPLGSYRGVVGLDHSLGASARWFVFHLGELDLSLAVFPFAALIVMAMLGLRPSGPSPAMRAFAAGSLCLVLAFVVTASLYAAAPVGQRIEERYMFHVAPLFMVALLAWIEWDLPRPRVAIGLAAAVAAALPGVIPYGELITSDILHDALGLVPLQVIEERWLVKPPDLTIVVTLAALFAVAVFVIVPRRFALVLPALLLVYYGIVQVPIRHRIVTASLDARRAGLRSDPGWVDREVPKNANVALVVYGGTTALPYWQNEFFNRTVNAVYTLSGAYDGLTQTPVAADDSGVLHDAAGHRIHARHVLSNAQVVPAGTELAADRGTGMTLYRTSSPLRIKETFVGIYEDRWSGPALGYTRYNCRGGRLRLTVLSDPAILRGATQTLTAYSGGVGTTAVSQKKARAGAVTTLTVPLRRVGRFCAVTVGVSPTAVPDQVTHSGDTRELGTRILRFTFEPSN